MKDEDTIIWCISIIKLSLIALIVYAAVILLSGCSTPPWSDRDLQKMENVNSVPIVRMDLP